MTSECHRRACLLLSATINTAGTRLFQRLSNIVVEPSFCYAPLVLEGSPRLRG
jgi:hypothetical protein